MTDAGTRRWMMTLTTLGAVAVGVVLGGVVNWTPGWSASADDSPVSIHAVHAGLPGFADLAEAVAPAVVTIRAVSFQEAPGSSTERKGSDPFFDFFFGPRGRKPDRGGNDSNGGGADPGGDSGAAGPVGPSGPERLQSPQEFRSEAGGSGFVISADGLIATNYHVIEGASELMVTVGDDPREVPAKVRGTDPLTDLALLQIDTAGRKLPHLKVEEGKAVRVGDWVMVVGNPLRLGRTVTVGVVSAVGRSGLGITDVSFENFLQTDAAINFGNSGGPMVNLDGEVVGIATAINWGAENVGFAVPASTIAKVIPQLEHQGKVRRGYLGVNVENVDYKAQEAFGLPAAAGALVIQVNDGTPGAEAGLQHGDIILAVDGHPVKTTRDLIDYVSDHPPGSQVQLDVLRDGKRAMRTVTVGERPVTAEEKSDAAPEEPVSPGVDWLGLRYGELSPAMRSAHGIPDAVQGVWIRAVSPHSPLVEQSVDVEPGDVIVEINGHQVQGVADFESVVKAARPGSYLRFYVQRFDPRSGRSGQFFAFARVP